MRWHGRTVAGVPRWAVWSAYAAALTVLPSGVWRLLTTLGHVPLDHLETAPEHHGPELVTGWWYPVALTVVSEALAYLTVGLVAPWGEVWPRWIPRLGGRPVPVAAAVVPAAAGAAALTVLWTWTAVMFGLGRGVNGSELLGLDFHGWQAAAFIAAYGPLLAWGPLLAAVTISYYRRRRGRAGRRGTSPVPG